MPETGIPRRENTAGRQIPELVNGVSQVPFQGVGMYHPEGNRTSPPILPFTMTTQDFPPILTPLYHDHTGLPPYPDPPSP